MRLSQIRRSSKTQVFKALTNNQAYILLLHLKVFCFFQGQCLLAGTPLAL